MGHSLRRSAKWPVVKTIARRRVVSDCAMRVRLRLDRVSENRRFLAKPRKGRHSIPAGGDGFDRRRDQP
jgi:hypothetical protein